MLFRDDVIKLKGNTGNLSRKVAILAAILCPVPNLLLQANIHRLNRRVQFLE